MKLLLLVSMSSLLEAQQNGQALFQKSCAVLYCHGPNGSAGRAPALAGHAFAAAQLRDTIAKGKPNSTMPGFEKQLPAEEIDALVAYLMGMKGSGSAPASNAAAVEARHPGQDLFFEAVRTAPCSTCHERNGRGVPIAPTLSNGVDLRKLSRLPAERTFTATPSGEPAFAASLVKQDNTQVQVYDLSSLLPVLRTFPAGAVQLTKGSNWTHTVPLSRYSAAELSAIEAYLNTLP